jgi:hypothetical protein
MLDGEKKVAADDSGGAGLPVRRRKLRWGFACTGLAVMAAAVLLAQNASLPAKAPQKGKADQPAAAAQAAAAKGQAEHADKGKEQKGVSPAAATRKKQIADDSAELLKMATDLKAEVDKTNKDELSLAVIRKADAIEKLARSVKEQLKQTVGGS